MHKYASIDIETTGLDPFRCQILEIGVVIETDWETPVDELPTFHCFMDLKEIWGQPYALAMNANIIGIIGGNIAAKDREKFTFLREADVAIELAHFVEKHGLDPKNIVAAGKNFASFDLQFLKQLPEWDKYIRFRHRYIDPAMLYWDPAIDAYPPSTGECMKRAGMTGSVSHTAVADARDIIELVRRDLRQVRTFDLVSADGCLEFKRTETRPNCIASSPVS